MSETRETLERVRKSLNSLARGRKLELAGIYESDIDSIIDLELSQLKEEECICMCTTWTARENNGRECPMCQKTIRTS